jgi:hypothetical protein
MAINILITYSVKFLNSTAYVRIRNVGWVSFLTFQYWTSILYYHIWKIFSKLPWQVNISQVPKPPPLWDWTSIIFHSPNESSPRAEHICQGHVIVAIQSSWFPCVCCTEYMATKGQCVQKNNFYVAHLCFFYGGGLGMGWDSIMIRETREFRLWKQSEGMHTLLAADIWCFTVPMSVITYDTIALCHTGLERSKLTTLN